MLVSLTMRISFRMRLLAQAANFTMRYFMVVLLLHK